MDDDILNMSDALNGWERPITIKAVTVTTVDFVEMEIVTTRTQNCVIQVADKERLNKDTIDWSKEYLLIHSNESLLMGELIEFNGKDYRVYNRGSWNGYGYVEVIAEETKEPIK